MYKIKTANSQKGIGLMLAVFLIVMTGLIAIAVSSLLVTGSASGAGSVMSVRAYGIAEGGAEWYTEQLKNDTDWTDETGQTGIILGKGEFDITINSASAYAVSFTVTGRISGYNGQNIQREAAITVRKLPPASLFAIYWGNSTTASLQFANTTTISGDFWSRGNTRINTGCSVTNGTAYRPDTKNIYGGGSYTEQAAASPYPPMPVLTSAYYDNLITAANALIDAAKASGSDINQTTDLVLSGGTISCRDFRTNGDITISGYGTIAAWRNMLLHSRNSDSGTLIITPSGGNINLLAGRNLYVNSGRNDTHIIMNQGVRMYSRSETSINQLTMIRKDANIDGALIIGNRRIDVMQGADITNSTLYVNRQTFPLRNYLRIRNSGTSVSGAVISRSRNYNGLIINNASVTGFVYHDGAFTGRTYLRNASVTGCVIAGRFSGNRIRNTDITYDWNALTSVPVLGFEGYIVRDITSWDDN